MQSLIQDTHLSENPNFRRSASRKDHSTLSKALLMSVFIATNLALQLGFVRRAWKTSCATKILSVIKRLATKADCVSDIKLGKQRLRRLLRIFEMIL